MNNNTFSTMALFEVRKMWWVWVALMSVATAGCAPTEQGSTTRGTVTASEELVLETSAGIVRVPANALPDGTEVGVSSSQAEDLEDSPIDGGLQAVSEVLTAEFSNAGAVSEAPIVVELTLPENFAGGAYGMVRYIGPGATDGVEDTGWRPNLGELDLQNSVLRITLIGATDRMSFVAVSRGSLPVAGSDRNSNTAFSIFSVANAQTASRYGLGTWPTQDLAWATWCVEGDFPDCTPDSPSMKELADLARQSATVLRGLDFDSLYLFKTTEQALRRTDDIINLHDGAGSNDLLYLIVKPLNEKRKPGDGKLFGYYDDRDGLLVVDFDVDSVTIIHELMHAAQRATATNIWGDRWQVSGRWFTEGTAGAIETLAPERPARISTGRNFRYEGGWRDWFVRLADDNKDFSYHYETSELWLHIDESLEFLHAMFQGLQAEATRAEITADTEYQVGDRVINSASGYRLLTIYSDLIETRDEDSRYPHCRSFKPVCDENACFLADPAQGVRLPAMSALCADLEIGFEELDCDRPEVEFEFNGSPDVHRFLLNGNWHAPGDKVTVAEIVRLWLINADIDASSAGVPSYDPMQNAKYTARCGEVSLISISQLISLSAYSGRADQNTFDMENHIRRIDYDVATGLEDDLSWTRNLNDVSGPVVPVESHENIRLAHSVESAGGATASADFSTSVSQENGTFLVQGEISLSADGRSQGVWSQSAGADAEWTMSVAIKNPSVIELTNCDVFSEDFLEAFGFVERSGGNCSLTVQGSGIMEVPSMAGLPGHSIDFEALFDDEDFQIDEDEFPPEMMAEVQAMMEDGMATQSQVNQARGIATALSGQVHAFSVVLNNDGMGGERERQESFTLRIVPIDPEEPM